MKVFINGEDVQVRDAATLKVVLEQLNYAEKKGIAVAVNNQVIPKEKWDQTLLSESDKMIIISATQGG